jgi:hypothetical protein
MFVSPLETGVGVSLSPFFFPGEGGFALPAAQMGIGLLWARTGWPISASSRRSKARQRAGGDRET